MTDVNGSADAGNPGGNAAPPEWLGAFDEGTRTALAAKGWVDPDPAKVLAKALPSYLNLEKTFGADRAGRTVVLPGEKATPDEIKAFHAKLGVPETPDGYKFELGEGADERLVGWFREAALKNGIPASAAAGLVKEWEGFAQAAQKQAQEAEQAANAKAAEEWRANLGSKADEVVNNAKKAMSALGLTNEHLDRFDDMLKALGAEGLIGVDLMAKLASEYKIGVESDAIEGNSNGLGSSGPEAARAALAEFERSDEWLKVAFDKNAIGRDIVLAKRDKLYRAAYPDQGDGFTVMGRAG